MTHKSHRPLSPHLQVYKPQITSIMSILHRGTGAVLAISTIALVMWLWAAAYDLAMYDCMHEFFNSILGQLMLIGWTVAFYYHLANGVRHLIWDMGKGMDIASINKSGIAALIYVVVATAATWIYIYQG